MSWVLFPAPRARSCGGGGDGAPQTRDDVSPTYTLSASIAAKPPALTPRDAERNRADVETVYGALPETIETTEVSMFPNILMEKRKPGARKQIAG